MKYETKQCRGLWMPEPSARKADLFDVTIALGQWDEEEDAEDERIFYYMDGEPLEVGTILSDGFIVTHIYDE